MATERGQLAVLVATICLFFLIFFMLPTPVGAISLCSGRGYRNGTNGLCMCAGGFHGEACEYTFCPFGESWFSKPLENNKRNLELVPCSNMGSCNPLTGNCACRDGFDGSACERTICPTTVQTVTTGNLVTENIFIEGAASSAQLAGTLDLSNTPHCSGHGVCKTMREMGAEFDGLALIRPPVSYSSWDADKFQGCLCDPGWEAYDCSRRSCPWGRDPSEGGGREERLVLQCMATEGYFALLVMGRYTDPIPFDAEPGLLKIALERNPLVGEVSVLMPALESEGGLPQVCGSNNVVSTTIIFKDQKGPMAPLLLTQNTSNTRQWPHGSTRLLLGDGLPVLRMATVHALHCVACPTCTGRVYFSYRNSISDPVDVTANGAAAAIEAALLGLPDLVSANWGMSINVTVRGTVDRICYAGTDNAIDIVFYSEYGNIPFLSLFDATQLPGDSVDSYPHNVTLSSNAAIGQSYECSRQGLCNYGSGTCTCFSASVGGQKKYRAASSDGYGAAGTIGDCGYLSREQQDCLVGGLDACNGQGFCGNSTGVCECYDGFSGITCTVRSCPRGAAWHDEPSAGDEAHAFAECSSMGLCDKLTGVCKCRPGYSGPACDIRDCERDKNSCGVLT
ncbi:hypothetical protein B484DRAFT_395569 [Ochromonadaceae sp. CCMP2298]|nr:hypothetical protein B484DRAFT_395569 [Ochromonadaceae sp. CCMP2298]